MQQDLDGHQSVQRLLPRLVNHAHAAAADLGEGARLEDLLLARLLVDREEVGQRHGDRVQDPLERTDRRVDPVALDQRDGGIADAGLLCERALGKAGPLACDLQPLAGGDVHGAYCVQYSERIGSFVRNLP